MSGAVDGRAAMLAAVRRGLRRGPLPEDAAEALRGRLNGHARRLIPGRARPADLAAQLAAMIVKEFGTVERVADVAAVPGAIADYLAAQNLPPDIVVAPHPVLAGVPWGERPLLTVRTGLPSATDLVGVQHCFAGIAETGTLMFPSGPERPTTMNLLPETHIAVLRESDIVGPYEDAWDRLRALGPLPRNVMLVTGPSRSADIEQTLELGAHGPRRLHVLLIAGVP